MLLLIGRQTVCAIEVLLKAGRIRMLAASRHASIDAAHLAKQAVAASPRLQRKGRAEVMLHRKVHAVFSSFRLARGGLHCRIAAERFHSLPPPSKSLILWRPRPELNRGTRFCRPLRNHS